MVPWLFIRWPACGNWRRRTMKRQLDLRKWFTVAICCWRRSRVPWRTLPSRSSAPGAERWASLQQLNLDWHLPVASIFTSDTLDVSVKEMYNVTWWEKQHVITKLDTLDVSADSENSHQFFLNSRQSVIWMCEGSLCFFVLYIHCLVL